MFAGSFSRSMAARTVSVTPLPASVTGGRTSAFILSEGQLPAAAADTPTIVDPAVMLARSRYWPKRRPPVMPSNMFVVSSVRRSRKVVATALRLDQTLAERKCRMALESIRNGYRWRGPRSMSFDVEEARGALEYLADIACAANVIAKAKGDCRELTLLVETRIAGCYRLDSKSIFSQLD